MYYITLIKAPQVKKRLIDDFRALVKESILANQDGIAKYKYGFDLDACANCMIDSPPQSWSCKEEWVKDLAHMFCNGDFIWFDENNNTYEGYRIKDGVAYNLKITSHLKYKLEKKL